MEYVTDGNFNSEDEEEVEEAKGGETNDPNRQVCGEGGQVRVRGESPYLLSTQVDSLAPSPFIFKDRTPGRRSDSH